MPLKDRLPTALVETLKPVVHAPAVDRPRRAVTIALQRAFDAYPPDYRVDRLPLRDDVERYRSLFDDSVANFEAILSPFRGEWSWSLGMTYNPYFSSVDAELYYSVVRTYRPRLIVEVGSGVSTAFASDALRRNGGGRVLSIDPEPRRRLPAGVRHIRSKVEDVDPSVFAELRADDVLFIDSSHTTQEARFHVESLLPALAEGVVVHHHDVNFPYAKYYEDDPQEFGEPDVLLEFYDANRDGFEILTCASYVRYVEPEAVRRLVPSYRWFPSRVPGSLWTRKRSAEPGGTRISS